MAGGALLFVCRRSDGCVEELKSYYTHVYHSRGKSTSLATGRLGSNPCFTAVYRSHLTSNSVRDSVFLVLFTTTAIIIYTAPSSTRRRQFIYLAKAFWARISETHYQHTGNNHSSVPRSHTTVADRMSPPVRVIITYKFPPSCRTGSVHVLLRTLEHQSAGGDGISVVNERESRVRKGNGRLSLISTVACVDMLTLLHSSASWLFQ